MKAVYRLRRTIRLELFIIAVASTTLNLNPVLGQQSDYQKASIPISHEMFHYPDRQSSDNNHSLFQGWLPRPQQLYAVSDTSIVLFHQVWDGAAFRTDSKDIHSYDMDAMLIATLSQRWMTDILLWENATMRDIIVSKHPGGEIALIEFIDKSWRDTTSIWKNSARRANHFNSLGWEISDSSFVWDESAQTWGLRNIWLNSYFDDGLLESKQYRIFQSSGMTIFGNLDSMYYNSAGNDSLVHNFRWNSISEVWDKFLSKIYNFNLAGLLETIVTSDWLGSWVVSSVDSLSYNASDLLVEQVLTKAGETHAASKTTYEYDERGNTIHEQFYVWGSGNDLKLLKDYRFTYDVLDRWITYEYLRFDTLTGEAISGYQYSYTYDSDISIDIFEYRTWEPSQTTWVNNYRRVTTNTDPLSLNPSGTIRSIIDRPDDSGGVVALTIVPSWIATLDSATRADLGITPTIELYTVWREADQMAWDSLGGFDATFDTIYVYDAPTVTDSSATTNGMTNFKIITYTSDDDTLVNGTRIAYESEVQSGYSVATIVAVVDRSGIPGEFQLHTNFPNPFNPSTTIGFDLPSATMVHLTVFNILGREVRLLVDQPLASGYHQAIWDGRTGMGEAAPTGIYFARINAADYHRTIKMVLLK